jgi:hypothetical protein
MDEPARVSDQKPAAKIFLSCGQREGSPEIECAKKIKEELKAIGFEVFLAIEVQTAQALTDRIYQELESSDYFIFIDFKREAIKPPSDNDRPACECEQRKQQHRGSLFSHQELAIANFLKMEFLPFQERGLERSGILSVIMGNATIFDDRNELPQRVASEVRSKLDPARPDWSLAAKNKLELHIAEESNRPDRQPREGGKMHDRTHYHIHVHNRHNRKLATNCCAYVEQLIVNQQERDLKQAELKWEGVKLPAVCIRPDTKRGLDAFLVLGETAPFKLCIPSHTDAGGQIEWDFEQTENAEIEVTFVVCSEQFQDAKLKLKVSFDNSSKLLDFEELLLTSTL